MSPRRARNPPSRRSRPRINRRPRTVLDRIRALNIGDAADAAVGAYQVATQLLALNTEVKFVDTGDRAATVNTGTVTCISLLAEGLTNITRTGESIRAHGLELRYYVKSTAATPTFSRIVVLVDNECRGAVPIGTDILEQAASAGVTTSPWTDLNRARFGILYDSGPIGTDPAGRLLASHTEVIPVNHHLHYDGAAGAIANSYEGNMFIAVFNELAAAGSVIEWTTRLHFVDN